MYFDLSLSKAHTSNHCPINRSNSSQTKICFPRLLKLSAIFHKLILKSKIAETKIPSYPAQ